MSVPQVSPSVTRFDGCVMNKSSRGNPVDALRLKWSMNADYCIAMLARFPAVLGALVRDLDDETLNARGDDGKAWSITEILCHLADEEVEDFRMRVSLTLTQPESQWPRIDPEAAALDRNYRAQDPRAALQRFMDERRASLRWLESLEAPDWSSVHTHPRVGPVPAGQLLASWAAHDLLHLRQITKRLFEMVQRQANPHPIDYAGQWTA